MTGAAFRASVLGMDEDNSSLRHSLLIRIAGAMTLLTLVILAGMGGAVLLLETMRGNAAAINIAGSLRMQSYQISSLVFAAHTPAQARDPQALVQAIVSFEQTLLGSALRNLEIAGARSSSHALWQKVVVEWNQELKPMLSALQSQSSQSAQVRDLLPALLPRTNALVADINQLVKQIELDAEEQMSALRTTIIITLLITLGVMLLTMVLFHRTLLTPLRDLLSLTTRIRRGDLAARSRYIGQDELGRLGHAFNLMAEDLDAVYRSLEQRVAEKTTDLERSNRSLELLYHSIARLYSGTIETDTFKLLLREIEEVLELGAGTTCLVEAGTQGNVTLLASTLSAAEGEISFCSLSSCAECMEGDGARVRELAGQRVLSIQLRDVERVHGVMQLRIPDGEEIEPWKMRLLEALSRHIGTAIGTFNRAKHERVLALLEERSVMARELHDSLAQSLSYMKIQVSRLASALAREQNAVESDEMLRELREGLNSAYRQLRELLTTFRLRIEEESLSAVLDKTVQEFAGRSRVNIRLDTQLTNCILSANEEIHILQIVREALANVVHHAEAENALITLGAEAEGRMHVVIEDDGVGIGNKTSSTHHYGMAIMEERARGLGGVLEIMNCPHGGTRVEVWFVPTNRRDATLLQQSA